MIGYYREVRATFADERFHSDDPKDWDELLAELIEDFGDFDGEEVWHGACTMLEAAVVDSQRRSRLG